jgi:tetratricopeptide (TPR) repeat protein
MAKPLSRLLSHGRANDAWHAFLSSTADPLDFLYRATQLAAQYEEPERALNWIRLWRSAHAARAKLSRPEALLYQALELAVRWMGENRETVQKALKELDWAEMPVTPWLYNLRLGMAIRNNRQDDVLLLLRNPTPLLHGKADWSDPYHRGNRLRLLGFYFFERGEAQRSLGYFAAALRNFSRDRCIDSRLRKIEIYGHWGKIAFREGRISESHRYLQRARRLAARFKHRLWHDLYSIELSWVYAHRGLFSRAERIARGVVRRQDRSAQAGGLHHFLHVKSLLALGHFAMDQGIRQKAARHVARASQTLGPNSTSRLRGYLHLLRGRFYAAGATEVASLRALEEFRLAEDDFLTHGDGDVPGLLLLAFYRGHHCIQKRDVPGTLREALRCMEIAGKRRFLPARSTSLLLKSQLLLQSEIPDAERLYEEVLRDLGAIHDNVILFRVVANLYLYSWELEDHLDLTDHHLQQLHRMKRILDAETFHRLYERFVTRPVIRRALVRTFGIDPDSLGFQ